MQQMLFQKKLTEQIIEQYHVPLGNINKGRGSTKCRIEYLVKLGERQFPSKVSATDKNANPHLVWKVCLKKKDNNGEKIRQEGCCCQCSECGVGLCVDPCIEKYHTKNFFEILCRLIYFMYCRYYILFE